MNLDELIADAAKRAKDKKRKRVSGREAPDAAYHRTKEELRQMKLDACVPVSVHLRVTYQRCECGATYESVNNYPLIRKTSPSLDHYEAVESQDPSALTPYNSLPRYIESKTIDIPWCTDCFANAREVSV